MTIVHNPPEVAARPTYSQAIEVRAGARTLYIAGQVGWDADGNIEEGIAAQTRKAFENLRAVLRSAGMDFENIVKTTIYVTDAAHIPDYSAVRSDMLGANKPASTLVVIKELARPELLVEIDATAVAE